MSTSAPGLVSTFHLPKWRLAHHLNHHRRPYHRHQRAKETGRLCHQCPRGMYWGASSSSSSPSSHPCRNSGNSPPAVKITILSTLTPMLERIPAFVNPFFLQLQRAFVKSASDPTSLAVRHEALQALGVLMKHQTRVDPVVTELITRIKTKVSAAVSSLMGAIKNRSQNIGEKARGSMCQIGRRDVPRGSRWLVSFPPLPEQR